MVDGGVRSEHCESFLKNFTGLARRTVGVPIPHQDKSFPADTIADISRGVGIPAQSSENVEAALAASGRFELARPPRLLIPGSLYLAGAGLHANGTTPV